MIKIETVWEASNTLGESPVWDYRDNRLYWVDSLEKKIQAIDPKTKEVESWDVPEFIGSIGLRKKGGLVAALSSGFGFFSTSDGSYVPVVDPEPELPGNRLNDGKVDKAGRFWCGSMGPNLTDPTAGLYCLDTDKNVSQWETDIVISNGIAWNAEGTTMYYADSPRQAVYAYDFDLEKGAVANRRTFIDFKTVPGRPDGATVDQKGNYWSAMIRGNAVGCFSPNGELIQEIKMPIEHPTMCMFGGENLDVLYVTSGTTFIADGDEANQPLGGALFAITGHGAQGFPEPYFEG